MRSRNSRLKAACLSPVRPFSGCATNSKRLPLPPNPRRWRPSIPDNGGVYFVPAFVGLGAPHWDPDARGLISGLTRSTGRAHIVRAALESIAYQTRELVEAMQADAGEELRELRVDGGAAVNDLLMQFQSDILGKPLVRPVDVETTALGAAYLAVSLLDFGKAWPRSRASGALNAASNRGCRPGRATGCSENGNKRWPARGADVVSGHARTSLM